VVNREKATIAVVGAGISGLTCTLALQRAGFRVDLYEAAASLQEVGAGITLAPNAMRGLDYLEVGERITRAGSEPSSQRVSHWQHGGTLLEFNRADTRAQYGAAYVYIHRADLQEILVDAVRAAGATLHLGKRLSAVTPGDPTATLVFDDGSEYGADLVIGADGLKSQVRPLFQPLPAHFTGHIAFRALAEASPAIQPLIDQSGMHIGPGKMVVRYPLRHGSRLNLVFFARQDGWTEDGWSIAAQPSELEALFGDWCEDVQKLLGAIAPGSLHKWAINAHSALDYWSLEGQVVLVGDAAHAMTPFMGQGAAMGIEDAVVLARAIADSVDFDSALQRYEAARLARTRMVQEESNLNADRLQGAESDLYGLGNLRNEETLGLFAYDCVTASV
jgi:salicylate hydroxylase